MFNISGVSESDRGHRRQISGLVKKNEIKKEKEIVKNKVGESVEIEAIITAFRNRKDSIKKSKLILKNKRIGDVFPQTQPVVDRQRKESRAVSMINFDIL